MGIERKVNRDDWRKSLQKIKNFPGVLTNLLSDYWPRLLLGVGIALATALAWVFQSELLPKTRSVIGLFCFFGIAFLWSTDWRQIDRRTVITGLLLQIVLGLLILRVSWVYRQFETLGAVARSFLEFSEKGAVFVFGDLGKTGGPFAFHVLPTVIFVSAFFSMLYYLGILQWLVYLIARGMLLLLGKRAVSGAETLSVSANVFIGQTEAPLIIKPFIPGMTRSELLAIMIAGMAHISGTLMAVYIGMGADAVAIFATSVMGAPASLYLSKILIPETGEPQTRGSLKMSQDQSSANLIDAASAGASEGMKLVLNIAAMLIAFLALIAMVNQILIYFHPNLTLEKIFGSLFSPIACLMGIESNDIPKVGEWLGIKLISNEFVAYLELQNYIAAGHVLDHRTIQLTTFALTGFANIASVGIQLGGIGAMAPERRKDLAQLGWRALFAGFLATLINATIAGILTH